MSVLGINWALRDGDMMGVQGEKGFESFDLTAATKNIPKPQKTFTGESSQLGGFRLVTKRLT